MGMMDRFGRIADTYISERNKLLEADTERRRTFTGHPFWPTEVLRDTIIFCFHCHDHSVLLLADTPSPA